ncbi:MAG: hypothetical protein ABL995_10685 [Bryobacteraceae bacterium]
MRLAIALFALLLVSMPTAEANDTDLERKSLRGLKDITVGFVRVPTELRQYEPALETDIQTAAELKLRLAGIKVLSAAEVGNGAGSGVILNISINAFPTNDGNWPVSVQVGVLQVVRLDRDASIFSYGETWGVYRIGRAQRSNLRSVRDTVNDMVDQFINAYLSVNPKK